MAAALTLLLIGSLLQGALCGKFKASMPKTIEVVRGSCVTIPCSFEIDDQYESTLDNTCRAMWINDWRTVVFDSSNRQSTNNGELRGDLTRKDCTTTLNNMQPANSYNYFFRVECEGLKYTFTERISISVTDDPPRPTLTPSALKVMEGTSVSLTCSAPAPCLSHPPTLTWTKGLGDSEETLQENQDKTKVKTSAVNFTASQLHHGKTISCTATYNKQDGSTESAVSTSLTADISCALCGKFKASMPKTIEVLRGSCVTIPCSFDVEDQYETTLDNTCGAKWMYDENTVFDSSNRQSTNNGELRGNLTRKDCTTNLNNMQPANSYNYFFRVECKGLNYNFIFDQISISVTDDPPRPTLTPSALKVMEGTSVSLTCSAPAPCLSHPPTLTWTKGLGDSEETLQENQDKTKVKTSVVTFTASQLHHGETISCTATYNKQDGSTESAVSTSLTADISFAPQILFSSDCIKAADQLNCSCRAVGNPSPTLLWYLDGSPVNHSDTFVVSNEPLNDTGLWSTITVNGPQERDLSTLLCRSSNSLGSATQRFCVNSLEPRTSEESQDRVMLTVFIAVVVALLVLVCVLLFVIRAQKTHHKRPKCQCTGDTGPVTMSHRLASGEGNEVPNTAEEDIYVNNDALTCADVAHPATVSGPNSTTLPSSGPNNAEGARKSSEKATDEGKDVIYSTVNWRTKSKKKKAEDSMDVHQPGSSYLQEEMCTEGGTLRGFVSSALEMGSLYDNMEPRNVQKEVESEYAQVKFKDKRAMPK